jgi:hypothetical protein
MSLLYAVVLYACSVVSYFVLCFWFIIQLCNYWKWVADIVRHMKDSTHFCSLFIFLRKTHWYILFKRNLYETALCFITWFKIQWIVISVVVGFQNITTANLSLFLVINKSIKFIFSFLRMLISIQYIY